MRNTEQVQNNMSSNGDKLRVLALHGYRQSDKVFSEKIGSFRKCFKKEVEFVFVRAPHNVPPIDNDDKKDEVESVDQTEQLGWWFNTEDKLYNSLEPSEIAFGFDESLELVQKTLNEKGPFDGILGFSQGASFVSLLCNMQQKKTVPIEFNFAIMISGFISYNKPHKIYYDEKISLPSLHVYGEGDRLVSKERFEALADIFTDKEISVHEGGHYVPGNKKHKHLYENFFKKMLEKKVFNKSE